MPSPPAGPSTGREPRRRIRIEEVRTAERYWEFEAQEWYDAVHERGLDRRCLTVKQYTWVRALEQQRIG